MKKIIIYTTSWCPWCQKTKKFLENLGYSYEERNVELNPEWVYDSIVIGASAAGMSAGIYLKRQKLNFLILAKDIGGEMALSGIIENYPGFPLTNGVELTQKFKEHLEKYEIEPVMEEVVKIEKENFFKVITLKMNIFLKQLSLLLVLIQKN
jgi:alkyl hydroperoxide reductase subunit AhpF